MNRKLSVQQAYTITDDEADERAFRNDFQACLRNLEHSGTFASFANTSLYVNPGLEVKRIGSIGLPLSQRDAKAITAVCRQSPFGRNDKTVVDETVRKTWELDGTEFICSNPSWTGYVETLAQKALVTLGVQVLAQAYQYKLLLYEEGAFFKPHRDTEKVTGMFGTLVICLPSLHTGGEVVLVHGGKTQTIETARTSAFDLSTLAWYSDVQHEIRPVTSGYRLVLTYNLVQKETPITPTAAELGISEAKLEKHLRMWIEDFPLFDYYVWPLEHQYTQASLNLRNLKGQDSTRCRALERLCSQNGAWWFLSIMTKTQVHDYEEYDDNEEEDLSLGQTFTPAGQSISLQLPDLEEAQILADVDQFYDREADSEEEGEYTGNESMPATQRYRDAVAIMVKKDHVISNILKQRHTCESLSQLYMLISKDQSINAGQRRLGLVSIMKSAITIIASHDNRISHSYHHSHFMHRSIAVSNETAANLAEFAKLFRQVSDYCYSIGDGSVASDVLLNHLVHKEDWAETKLLLDLVAPIAAKDVISNQTKTVDKWLSSPSSSAPTYKYVNSRRIFFDAIKNTLPAETVPLIHQKMQQELDSLVKTVTSVREEDIEPLIQLVMGNIPPQTYLDNVLPVLVKNPNWSILSSFLHSVGAGEDCSKNHLDNILRPTFQRILPVLKSTCRLSIDQITTQCAWNHTPYYSMPPWAEQLEISAQAKQVLEITQKCVELGLQRDAEHLLTAALPNPESIPDKAWGTKWESIFILIEHLLNLLNEQQDVQLNSIGSQFITKAIQRASSNLAHRRPHPPQDWSQPHVKYVECSCPPCQAVTRFLVDNHQSVGRFSYAQRVRSHLRDSFKNPQDFIYSTDTGRVPHTLVIQKTRNQYKRDLSQWEHDVKKLRSRLAAIQSDFVSKLLVGNVIDLSGLDSLLGSAGALQGPIRAAAQQQTEPRTASASNKSSPRILAGRKRRIDDTHSVDVIDLT